MKTRSKKKLTSFSPDASFAFAVIDLTNDSVVEPENSSTDIAKRDHAIKATPSKSTPHQNHGSCHTKSSETESSRKVSQESTKPSDTIVLPEHVKSTANAVPKFDEKDYNTLYQRYLTPRIRENVQLAGGMTLRRQYKGRIIDDQKTVGYKKLKSKIDILLKKQNHEEVYVLLCQLRDWELNPMKVPDVFKDSIAASPCNNEVAELLDLSNDLERQCIDVDARSSGMCDIFGKDDGNGAGDHESPLLKLREFVGKSPDCVRSNMKFDRSINSSCIQVTCGAKYQVRVRVRFFVTNLVSKLIGKKCKGKRLFKKSWSFKRKKNVRKTINGKGERFEPDPIASMLAFSKCSKVNPDVKCKVQRLSSVPMTRLTEAKRVKRQPMKAFDHTNIIDDIVTIDLSKENDDVEAVQCSSYTKHIEHKRLFKTEEGQTASPLRNVVLAPIGANDGVNEKVTAEKSNQLGCPFSPVSNYNISPPSIVTPELSSDENRKTDIPTDIQQSEMSRVDSFGTQPAASQFNLPYASCASNQLHQSGTLASLTRPTLIGAPFYARNTRLLRSAGAAKTHKMPSDNDFVRSVDAALSLSQMKKGSQILSRRGKVPMITADTKVPVCIPDSASEVSHKLCAEKKKKSSSLQSNNEGKHQEMNEKTSEVKSSNENIAANAPRPKRVPKKKRSVVLADKKSLHYSVVDFSYLCSQNEHFHLPGNTRNARKRINARKSLYGTHEALKCRSHLITKKQVSENSSWRNKLVFSMLKNTLHPDCLQLRNNVTKFVVVPSCRMTVIRPTQKLLADEWKEQSRKRRKGEWLPTGGWIPPKWAPALKDKRRHNAVHKKVQSQSRNSPIKPTGCKKSLLPRLEFLINSFMSLVQKTGTRDGQIKLDPGSMTSLCNVVYPEYIKPTLEVLKNAHLMVQSLLPDGDCESFDVIKVARQYYDYWRPSHGETRVIILAESHAFTERDRTLNGPGLDKYLLDDYYGPREFVSLVYCLAYGENDALSYSTNDPNKGTPQFWSLFAACSRGVEHVPTACNATACNAKTKNVRSQFAIDVLKGGGLSVQERLKAKLAILADLRRRGIWLLDASLFGWYISQPQEFSRSSITNEIHRKAKCRPPKDLKAPSLVLSWELFTKHVIREVANEGSLKWLIPIGMEVEASLTRKRLQDAISSDPDASVAETFPAPNAWIPGGYGPFHAKLADLVNKAAPRGNVKSDNV